jgi:hypothetical protein
MVVAVVKLTFYKINDQYIEIAGLEDGLAPGTFFNAATVVATLKDREGNVVPEVDGIVCSYVALSNGVYRGPVQESFDPTPGGGYQLFVTASQGGVVGNWTNPAVVEIRRFEA